MAEPTGRRITPSKPDYWHGTPGDDERGYTVEQLRSMVVRRDKMQANQRNFRLPGRYIARIRTLAHYEYPALDEWADFPCPVVSCTRDRTKLCVIAPNGMEHWIIWTK